MSYAYLSLKKFLIKDFGGVQSSKTPRGFRFRPCLNKKNKNFSLGLESMRVTRHLLQTPSIFETPSPALSIRITEVYYILCYFSIVFILYSSMRITLDESCHDPRWIYQQYSIILHHNSHKNYQANLQSWGQVCQIYVVVQHIH